MTSQVDQALSVLEDTASLLKRTQLNLKKCPKERLSKPGYLRTRIETIEEYWNTFKKAHQDLLKCTTREQRGIISYFMNEEFYLQEDLYLCILGDLKDLLASVTMNASDAPSCNNMSCQGQAHTKVKLPSIKLPAFSGNYEEWPTFKDLYVSLIHECNKLTDVEKLHYLKTSITGEAASLLKHVQVTGANYVQAWETLNHRYNNKRLIVNALLKRLFSLKKCTNQSAAQLKALLDTTSEVINSLNNLNVPTDSWDPVIIFLIVQKLDPESHKEWEQSAYSANAEELATWKDLRDFLEATFRTLELVTPTSSTRTIKERVFHITTSDNDKKKSCVLCKDMHTLCHCKKFNNMSIRERGEHVKINKLCLNCLGVGHSVFKCRMPMSCRICKRRHHTLLHQSKNTEESVPQVDSQQPTSSTQADEEEKKVYAMVGSHFATERKMALLATAIVKLQSETGNTLVLKALIDSGSQACFISEKATQILKLSKSSANLIVSGMESMKVRVKQEINVQVLSLWDDQFKLPIKAYVMSKHLTSNIPSSTTMETSWPHLKGIQLADEYYYEPGTIDLLLGVNEYAAILKQGLIKGPPGTPCAQNTSLGWILMGGISMKLNTREKSLTIMKQEVDIEELLKTIWEVETNSKRKYSQEEQLSEEIYKTTHKRDRDGRYIVQLPFNTENPKSSEGNTREVAKRRFLQLERRFSHNTKLKEEYTKVIEEYINLKHMEEVPKEDIENKSVYLPHHAVIRNDKETTKTRVVFDASCKGSNGVSLNDELLLGPVLQDDLRSLIMRWRTHSVCFVSDIQKMYRMIWVDKRHTDYQRILWRNDPSEDIKDYRLLTVTFGTASAPYLAVRTLMQLADDEGDKYPEAAKILREDLYVDDVISGSDTVEQAVKNSQDLQRLLSLGGFELKKWSSNNSDFLQTIKPSERSSKAILELSVDGTIKALGIQWNLGQDQFEYSLNLPPISDVITKRSILSDVQRLFDPLGWIAPCLVKTKILIQQLWLEKVDWDTTLNAKLAENWREIRSDLENVNDIYIKRWMNTTVSSKDDTEIHGFSDASVQAYGAVVYCRVKMPDNSIKTTIIAARTRVAPLKTISLPRLELCGALLLSRLLKQVMKAIKIPASSVYAWTDSSIVISWLQGDPNKWKTFVANRVVEITNNINSSQWYHVLSHDNPADIASRGTAVANLKKCDLWWNGPQWLLLPKIQFTRLNILPTSLERKRNIVHALKLTDDQSNKERKLSDQFDDFQTLIELLRTIVYSRRFLKQKTLKETIDKIITAEELHLSLQICIKRVQEDEFEEEIKSLKKGKAVKRSSKLKSLNPYLDEDGVIRVGGRLRNAEISNEMKHPIILGHDNKLTIFIIAEAHSKTLHGGVQLMLTYLRSQYWILRAKALVKKCIHRCLICAKLSAKARTQVMGDLPTVRVKPARAFLNSGVDFAGPFNILISKGRGAKTSKAYIAIFVCMATKAIHLELVGDLSSTAFIGAFKRFCARRGKCTNIWSDQGRNFVGANKELADAWKEARLQFNGEIAEQLANDGTQWHFIPAYSPNFGGLWEAGVKSMKFHLKRILSTNLTFEEMTTVLCEIEACLNSRPLCPTDNESMNPLTPGHFLITEAPIIVPGPNIKDANISNLTRWQYTRKLLNDFWSRWQNEYLNRLQQRPKWLKREKEFQVGEIVLIKQENLPPGKWSMGRITEKHPGPDGLTRVYSVKGGAHITRRCVTKLCALPIADTIED